MKLIYSILRFAKERGHLEELRHGRLRLNTLGYYLNYEGHGAKARADKDEGLIGIYQPSQVRVFIGADKSQHEIDGICSPIKVRLNRVNEDHVFCMYALHPGPWADQRIESVEEFSKFLEVKDDNREFGNHVLFTLNTQEFLNRIVTSLKSQGFSFTMGAVEYVDDQIYNGKIPSEKLGFIKSKKNSYQNEYRLYIPNEDGIRGIRYLDVGDLSDITAISTFDEFKRGIRIEFSEEK